MARALVTRLVLLLLLKAPLFAKRSLCIRNSVLKHFLPPKISQIHGALVIKLIVASLQTLFLSWCSAILIKISSNGSSKTFPRIQKLLSTVPGNTAVCGLESHCLLGAHLPLGSMEMVDSLGALSRG